MQAVPHIPYDPYHRRPVSSLTWQKSGQKQWATLTRDCLPARVGTLPLPRLSYHWAYRLLELPQRCEVLVRKLQAAATGFDLVARLILRDTPYCVSH